MISFSLSRRKILIIILFTTVFALLFFLFLNFHSRFHNKVVSKEKWNSIIESREENNKINISSITFNDYQAIISEDKIYYSLVSSKNMYNPMIHYKTSNNCSVVVSGDIDDNSTVKIMVYNKKYYHIYSLVVTKYSLLSIDYDENYSEKNNPMKLSLFDNHEDSIRRLVESDGKIMIIKDNVEYHFSLTMNSLGRNKRVNEISLFGMSPSNKYILLRVKNEKDDDFNCVQLFINNKYKGLYVLEHRERRKDNER